MPGALCTRGSDEYWALYDRVRDAAYAHMRAMPAGTVLVMTNALTRENAHEIEAWSEVKRLARDRGDSLIAVTLHCDLEENMRRIDDPDRAGRLKLTEPRLLAEMRASGETLETGEGADHVFELDVTRLAPEHAAQRIAAFVNGCSA